MSTKIICVSYLNSELSRIENKSLCSVFHKQFIILISEYCMTQVRLAVLGYKCILVLVLNSLLCLTHLGRSCLSGKEMAANQLGNEQISSDLTFFWFCRMPFLSLWDRWETLRAWKLWRLLHWDFWDLHELVNHFINVISNVSLHSRNHHG